MVQVLGTRPVSQAGLAARRAPYSIWVGTGLISQSLSIGVVSGLMGIDRYTLFHVEHVLRLDVAAGGAAARDALAPPSVSLHCSTWNTLGS